MTDRWTEAQLRGQLYWVLSLEYAGGTWYLSTDALEISSSITTSAQLVDVPDVSEALEIWSVDAPTMSVPLSFLLPVDVPLLISQGHALDGAVGELAQWAEGTSWDDRRIIVKGRLVDPSYGAEWEPITCSLEEQVQDDATNVPPTPVYWRATFGAPLANFTTTSGTLEDGELLPFVYGRPGNGEGPGSKCYAIGLDSSTLDVYYCIAAHAVDASTVDITDGTATATCTVYHLEVPQLSEPLAYVILPVASGVAPELANWVVWTGRALQDETGAVVRGAGDLLSYLLRRSTLRVDWGRMEAMRQRLNMYQVGGYVDEPCALGEYLRDVVADVVPFAFASGSGGLYPYAWPIYPTAAEAIAHLDSGVDPSIERASSITYEGADEVANYIQLRYGWNPLTEKYTGNRRISGQVDVVDSQMTAVSYLAGSHARYGRRRSTIESVIVHDRDTADMVLLAKAARYGNPSRLVSYRVGPRWGWLRRGDVVTLTDDEVAASQQVAFIESIQWDPAGDLSVSLRYIEAVG
jgi:hypothetical protein